MLRRTTFAAGLFLLVGVPVCGLIGTALAAGKGGGAGALLPGSSSKEPVSIDAGKLDYFDKEQKLIYSGDVVARQGESTLKASVLTIYLSKTAAPDSGDPAKAVPGQGSSIDRMEARGPVMVISKDEVGTGEAGTYNKGENKITLTGNVTLTQGTNVIKGDRLVYDMTSGQAQVSGRVSSVFTPGSGAVPGTPKKPKPVAKGELSGAKPPVTAPKAP